MSEKKVDTTLEAVEDNVAEGLEENQNVHIVKQERTRTFNKRFGWSTEFNRVRFEESRTVAIPADTPYDAVYVHEILTQADVTHMVLFNAYNQGYMERPEFEENLQATVKVLKKASPYMKKVKQIQDELEQYEEIASIYSRLRGELVEEGILKTKKAKGDKE